MAIMIPDMLKGGVTAGERLLYRTLRDVLPDDYIVYFEPEIRGVYPDFVIIAPDMGIIVLEVKDYTRGKLVALNSDKWTILTDQGEKRITSPLKQARDYMFKIMNVLDKDKDLVQLEGPYKMKLKFPCGYGTVFTRLSQEQFIKDDLYDIIDANLCFTKDEIDMEAPDFDAGQFMEKLMGMLTVPFRIRESMTAEELNRIRYHLFPEVRIGVEQTERTPYNDQILLSLHDIKVMDLHQEKLAKQMGDRNRLIRGVAGSGKTLILASRAKILAKQHPDWRILVLCYNISLAKTIENMVELMMSEPEDLFDFVEEKHTHQIVVRNFHQFLKQDLKIHEKQIPYMVDKLERGEAILPKYDAILIDEGQDFDENWYRLVTKCLNPETMSLLLVEDRAQDIYRRKRSLMNETGLDFRGRSKVLNINYRNTAQIVQFAWDFYQHFTKLGDHLIQTELKDDIIIPKGTKRKGPLPYVKRFRTPFDEARFIALQIDKLHKVHGLPYEEMLILYRVKYANNWPYVDILCRELKEHGIPFYWVTENEQSKHSFKRDEPSVKICTVDSSKGMDFTAVFFSGLQEMPFTLEENFEKEISRAYIGMTRAKQYLSITSAGPSQFMYYFEGLTERSKEKNDGGSDADAQTS